LHTRTFLLAFAYVDEVVDYVKENAEPFSEGEEDRINIRRKAIPTVASTKGASKTLVN